MKVTACAGDPSGWHDDLRQRRYAGGREGHTWKSTTTTRAGRVPADDRGGSPGRGWAGVVGAAVTRIVTTVHRYKPPRKRKAVAITGPRRAEAGRSARSGDAQTPANDDREAGDRHLNQPQGTRRLRGRPG